LRAATVRSFAHMPLGISNHNNIKIYIQSSLAFFTLKRGKKACVWLTKATSLNYACSKFTQLQQNYSFANSPVTMLGIA